MTDIWRKTIAVLAAVVVFLESIGNIFRKGKK